MLKDIIEFKRNQLYKKVGLVGLSSEETIKISTELDRFINYHSRVSSPLGNKKAEHANVHANAIENILYVANKEKLELPFEFNTALFDFAEWFRLDVVHTFLYALSERYGDEIVEHIGESVPDHCIFPNTVQNFYEALKGLDTIFHMNHHSTDYIGEYLPFTDIKDEVVLFCHTPHYSASFNHGIIKGLAKKFNHSLNLQLLDCSTGGQFKILG